MSDVVSCLQARATALMPSFDVSDRSTFTSTLKQCNSLAELLDWTLGSRTFSLSSCSISVVFCPYMSVIYISFR